VRVRSTCNSGIVGYLATEKVRGLLVEIYDRIKKLAAGVFWENAQQPVLMHTKTIIALLFFYVP
jgi:hypothetical protein